MTMLVNELRATGLRGRPARVLNVMGMRAQESPARRLLDPFTFDEGSSSRSRRASRARRHVWAWLPVHDWTADQVWADIKASGVPFHWAYKAGFPRLSCRFCVLAPQSALVRAAQLDPAGAAARVRVEQEFQRRLIVTTLAVVLYAQACGWPQPVPRPVAVRTLRRAWRAGWKFQAARSMLDIVALAEASPRPPAIEDWAA
jgi:3'-phosphoadenosine 5'-phosphosulfate sulfotransferase (PAPS reductase)/FAD synthetase